MIHVENCNGYVQIYSSVIYINNHNNNLKRNKWSKEAGTMIPYSIISRQSWKWTGRVKES